VFAEATGNVIEEKRPEIQALCDSAVNFSEDNGMTPADVARLQRCRSFMAIGVDEAFKALGAGLSATVAAILDDAAGELIDAAGDVTSQLTNGICVKLLSAFKADRVLLDVALGCAARI
jgi:hypothetical protein